MDNMKKYYNIILRHDTIENWLKNDPVLLFGEYGVEDDTHKVKRGDGSTKWSKLPYETFGIECEDVSFENITGNVMDNEQLVQEFETKISKDIFEDVNNSVISAINVTQGDDFICKITRISKDITSGNSLENTLLITSNDSSIRGIWTVNDEGSKVLNLSSESIISDYLSEASYKKNQLCVYNNRLYMAAEDLETTEEFDETKWHVVSAANSGDVSYDNTQSGIEADTVQGAIDELSKKLTELEEQMQWTDYE